MLATSRRRPRSGPQNPLVGARCRPPGARRGAVERRDQGPGGHGGGSRRRAGPASSFAPNNSGGTFVSIAPRTRPRGRRPHGPSPASSCPSAMIAGGLSCAPRRRRSRPSATASPSRPPTWPSSSSRSRSPSAIRARSRAIPTPGLPANPDPIGDPDYCQSLVGPNANQIPDRLTLVRPAHGRRIVQQPVPGPGEVRGRGPAVPAPDDPGRSVTPRPARPISSARQRHHPGLVVRAEERLRVRHAAPPDLNLIVDQTSTNPAAVAAASSRSHAGQPGRRAPCGPDPARRHRRSAPAASRRTRRCSSRT